MTSALGLAARLALHGTLRFRPAFSHLGRGHRGQSLTRASLVQSQIVVRAQIVNAATTAAIERQYPARSRGIDPEDCGKLPCAPMMAVMGETPSGIVGFVPCGFNSNSFD